MLIRYKKANIYRCMEMRLIPGMNEVKGEVWDKVKDHPLVKARIKSGEIVIVKSEARQADPVSNVSTEESVPETYPLADMNTNEAKEIVKETLSLSLLNSWKDQENRKAVLAMIEKQIELLSKTAKKKETEEEESN